MLSVRVAAAVARALPRRAGLVSAGSRRQGGGSAAVGGDARARPLFLRGGWGAVLGLAILLRWPLGLSWAGGGRALWSPRAGGFRVLQGRQWPSCYPEMAPPEDSSLCLREALSEGQDWGASFTRPAAKRRGSVPLLLRDFLVEGQSTVVRPGWSELGEPDIVLKVSRPQASTFSPRSVQRTSISEGGFLNASVGGLLVLNSETIKKTPSRCKYAFHCGRYLDSRGAGFF